MTLNSPLSLRAGSASLCHWAWLYILFAMVTGLMGVKYCLIVVLVCNSQIISDVEYFHMLIIYLCIFLKKCLFKSFGQFLNQLFTFFLRKSLHSGYQSFQIDLQIFSIVFGLPFPWQSVSVRRRRTMNKAVLSCLYLSGLSHTY